MSIFWKGDTQSSCCENLNRNRANPLFPTHDMSDCHHIIINHNSSMICRVDSVRLQEYSIIDLRSLEFDTSTNDVVEDDRLSFWDFESNSTFFSIIDAISSFIIGNMSTVTIVSRWELEFFLLFPKSHESLRSTEAIIRTSLFAELMKSRCIFMESFTLSIGSIFSLMMGSLIRHYLQDCMNL